MRRETAALYSVPSMLRGAGFFEMRCKGERVPVESCFFKSAGPCEVNDGVSPLKMGIKKDFGHRQYTVRF
jgi:hypothetical protein